jgi:hypothetical protein
MLTLSIYSLETGEVIDQITMDFDGQANIEAALEQTA